MLQAVWDPDFTRTNAERLDHRTWHKLDVADIWDLEGRPLGRLYPDVQNNVPLPGDRYWCLLLCSGKKGISRSDRLGERAMLALKPLETAASDGKGYLL
jgi:hypothetical protein